MFSTKTPMMNDEILASFEGNFRIIGSKKSKDISGFKPQSTSDQRVRKRSKMLKAIVLGSAVATSCLAFQVWLPPLSPCRDTGRRMGHGIGIWMLMTERMAASLPFEIHPRGDSGEKPAAMRGRLIHLRPRSLALPALCRCVKPRALRIFQPVA